MKIGNATLVLECNERNAAEDYGSDEVGFGTAYVSPRDYLRLHKRNEFMQYSIDKETAHLALKEGQTLALTSDDLIVFLNAAMTEPRRKYEIEFDGLSSWFWHDVYHAMHDVQGGVVFVNGYCENRALYGGAKLALANGSKLEQIVRELVKAEAAFALRYKDEREPDALDRFLGDLEMRMR